jgi:hypothetical protein
VARAISLAAIEIPRLPRIVSILEEHLPEVLG